MIKAMHTHNQKELAYIVMKTAIAQFNKPPRELVKEELDTVTRQAQVQLTIQSTVLSSPEARDVNIPDPVLEQAIGQIIARYPSTEEFQEDLARNNVDYDSFEQAIRKELRVEAVLDKVASQAAEVSELDAQVYYYLHPQKFEKPETRKLRHILVTINEQFAENTRSEALKKVSAIYNRVQDKPHRFAEQALKHSECPTAMQGGQMGVVRKGDLYPELEQVAFDLAVGEVSRVVESPLGYHILYCEEIHGAEKLGMESVIAEIKEFLQNKRMKVCQRTWIAQRMKQKTGQ